eukprot:2390438-Rhodomonas_salina.1
MQGCKQHLLLSLRPEWLGVHSARMPRRGLLDGHGGINPQSLSRSERKSGRDSEMEGKEGGVE